MERVTYVARRQSQDPGTRFDEQDSGPPRQPYTWIVPPLVIFLAVTLLATAYQLRRRRRRRAAAARRNHPPPGAVAGGGRGTASDPEQPGRAPGGAGPRGEEVVEGLDERGEAPPPYEPAGAKERVDLEMGRLPGYEDDAGSGVAVPPAAVTHPRSE